MKMKSYLRGIGLGMIVTASVLHFTIGSKAGGEMSDEQIKAAARKLGMIENTVLSVNPMEDNVGSEVDAGQEGVSDSSNDNSEAATPITDADIQEIGDVAVAGPEEDVILEEDEGTSVEKEPEFNPEEPTEVLESTQPAEEDDKKEEADKTIVEENAKPEAETPDQKEPQTTPEAETEQPSQETPVITGEKASITIVRGDSSYSAALKLQQAGLIEDAQAFDKYLCANRYDKSIRVGVYEIAFGASYEEIAKTISSAR